MEPITMLILLGSLIGAAVEGVTAKNQLQAQRETNETNIELQKMANEAQLQQVRESNEFNAAQAELQRSYEKEMRATAVQTAMADYAAAGVNPLMALPGGATVPSGASAQSNVAHVGAAKVAPASLDLSGVASAIQSMTNFMLTSKLLSTKESQVEVNAYNAKTKAKFADLYGSQVGSRNYKNTAQGNLYQQMMLNMKKGKSF